MLQHPWVAEQRSGPRFGVLTQASADWRMLRELAQAVEEAGFDSLWLPDHPLVTADSWTTLAGIAEATDRSAGRSRAPDAATTTSASFTR